MTFSIVARDPRTGQLGVATATAGPAVGSLVPHVRAGTVAIATQAMTNPYLAIDLISHLERMPLQEALDAALAADPDRDRRQLIAIDHQGRTAMWTGSHCEDFAGHRSARDVVVAGNMLTGPDVLPAMLEAFDAAGTLPERLLAALVAGKRAGGDRRGTGSAALRVHGREAYPEVDLRVDWSPTPVEDLAAMLGSDALAGYAAFIALVPRRH